MHIRDWRALTLESDHEYASLPMAVILNMQIT